MKKKIFFLSICCMTVLITVAQNVGIGTTTPNASALLDVSSTNRGLLPPRMTAVQRNAIASPANGLMVYDTDSASLMVRSAGIWNKLSSTALGDLWRSNGGDAIYSGNAGNVGIGVSAPLFKLDLLGRMLIRGDGNILNTPGVVFTNTAGTMYNGLVGTQSDSLIGFYGSGNNMPNNGWGLNMNIYNGRVGIGTNNAKAALHVADSNVLFSGGSSTVPATDPYPDPAIEGPGRRMMWYPGKAAFRVGYATTEWDKDSIGRFSFASGWRTVARVTTSTALGEATKAYEEASTALGSNTLASGYASLAAGFASRATEYAATATGFYTNATGPFSTAMGYMTMASGTTSTALGYETKATNNDAFAVNQVTVASGAASFAAGTGTKAKAVSSAVFGRYNDSTDAPNPTTPALTDRIFQIGNGSADNNRSNALTVLRNGYLGIGETNPQFPLTFAGSLGDKISFRETGGGFAGFGIDLEKLQIHSATSTTDVSFGYGSNASFTERVRVINSGEFGMSVNGRMVLNTGTQSAGMWLSNTANNALPSFIGLRSDNLVGFYGNGSPNSGWGMLMNTSNGRVGIGTDNPSQALHVIGNILASGTITQNSDARLKKDIVPLSNTLEVIQQLSGYSYHWIDASKPEEQIGLLAQELQKVYPQLVKENDEGTLSVNYSGMVPVLLTAIKEQQQQIAKQQSEIDALKKMMQQLIKNKQ